MKKRFLIAVELTGLGLAVFFAFNYFRRGMDSAEVIRKLQGIRMAVELFHQAQGRLPADIAELLQDGTLEAVPELKLKRHPAAFRIRNAAGPGLLDTGSWAYVNDPASAAFGTVFIDCAHQDEKGRYWSWF
jgi:hypothetical protein